MTYVIFLHTLPRIMLVSVGRRMSHPASLNCLRISSNRDLYVSSPYSPRASSDALFYGLIIKTGPRAEPEDRPRDLRSWDLDASLDSGVVFVYTLYI